VATLVANPAEPNLDREPQPGDPMTVEEYLHSSFEVDMDLVDGYLEDRHVGELDHFKLQRMLSDLLRTGEQEHGYMVVQETRLQVAPRRFRVPDTCLVRRSDLSQVLRKAPLLCVEVMSPEDRMGRMQERCDDYFRMGVREVWVINPRLRTLTVLANMNSAHIHRGGRIPVAGMPLDLAVDALFQSLDEL
jgi:Uma2 family endonuclease